MKKLLTTLVLVAGSAITGLLVWRKVESDRQEDLWAEAEDLVEELDAREGTGRGTERVAR